MESYQRVRPKSPWREVSKERWRDWRWQLKNQIRSVDDLRRVIRLTPEQEAGVASALTQFRMSITPYYASLIDPDNPDCPIRAQAVPTHSEVVGNPGDLADPLAEEQDSPTPGLTHRYPDRVLLLTTSICSMYCRHCTRRRLVGQVDRHFTREMLNRSFEYIAAHPEVRDVIVSGGDPLVMGDEAVEHILRELRRIPHVEIIRLGTRTPVVLPMRISDALCRRIRRYAPVYVNTHFNHPDEATADSLEACGMLADHGIPVANQSVLLRGVNDCPHVMRQLAHRLLAMRVRPYYIFQCDLSLGIGHFRTSIGTGIEIIEALRGHTSGLAVPTFVVDLPGGGGKVPVQPDYLISRSDGQAVLRNFEGTMVRYDEQTALSAAPACGSRPACADPRYRSHAGPAMLFEGERLTIGPELPRRKNSGH